MSPGSRFRHRPRSLSLCEVRSQLTPRRSSRHTGRPAASAQTPSVGEWRNVAADIVVPSGWDLPGAREERPVMEAKPEAELRSASGQAALAVLAKRRGGAGSDNIPV